MKVIVFVTILIFWDARLISAGELSAEFEKRYGDYVVKYEKDALNSIGSRPYSNDRTETGITEIALERSACYGTCPIYTAKISRTGALEYYGVDYIKRKGCFTATISPYTFDNIAEFANRIKFKGLLPVYTSNVTDQATVFTKVTYSDGSSKIVSNYADCGPADLWVFQELIDYAISQASDWKKLKRGAARGSTSSSR